MGKNWKPTLTFVIAVATTVLALVAVSTVQEKRWTAMPPEVQAAAKKFEKELGNSVKKGDLIVTKTSVCVAGSKAFGAKIMASCRIGGDFSEMDIHALSREIKTIVLQDDPRYAETAAKFVGQ